MNSQSRRVLHFILLYDILNKKLTVLVRSDHTSAKHVDKTQMISKVHTPNSVCKRSDCTCPCTCLRIEPKEPTKPRACLHQSGERFSRRSPGLLSEKAHDAPEVLVQLASPREGGGLHRIGWNLEQVHSWGRSDRSPFHHLQLSLIHI